VRDGLGCEPAAPAPGGRSAAVLIQRFAFTCGALLLYACGIEHADASTIDVLELKLTMGL